MSCWAVEAALRSESRRAMAWSSDELVLADLVGNTRRVDDLAGIGGMVVLFTVLTLGTGMGGVCDALGDAVTLASSLDRITPSLPKSAQPYRRLSS